MSYWKLPVTEICVLTMVGLTCKYAEGHCQDFIYDDIYWFPNFLDPRKTCDFTTFIVLYEGPALISTHYKTATSDQIEMVTVNKGSMTFSLVRTTETLICRQ